MRSRDWSLLVFVLTSALGGPLHASEPRGLPECAIAGRSQHAAEIEKYREIFFSYRTQFEDPGAAAKPTEAELRDVTDRMWHLTEKLTERSSPRERSDAWVMYGRFLGLLTNYYRSGMTKINLGKESFRALQDAVFADPSNTDAWEAYSRLILSLTRMNSVGRFFAEKTLGLHYRPEREKVVECLKKGVFDAMLLKDAEMIEAK
ncbi:MAG: hypothetical protein ACXWPM_06575 [Bdellovibrionota bacterium]